jgi:hypothetical protein
MGDGQKLLSQKTLSGGLLRRVQSGVFREPAACVRRSTRPCTTADTVILILPLENVLTLHAQALK